MKYNVSSNAIYWAECHSSGGQSAIHMPELGVVFMMIVKTITNIEPLKQGISSDFRGVFPTTPGERLNGIQEVSGSIPLISTNWEALEMLCFQGFPFVLIRLWKMLFSACFLKIF